MKNIRQLTFILFLVSFVQLNAQKDRLSLEINVGTTTGDSRDFFSTAIQGNIYYLWNISDAFHLGVTTGFILLVGEGNNVDPSDFLGIIPDVHIPIAISSKIVLSDSFYTGLDIGYGLKTREYEGESTKGGFYLRPLVAYKLRKKLALVLSYASISESAYNFSSLSLGANFGL